MRTLKSIVSVLNSRQVLEQWVESFALPVAVIILMATWFYFPALFRGRTLANGDIAVIDLPLFKLFAQVIRGEASALWAPGIFGGHPIFAEGQAAFANPLNIVWSAIVTPAVGPVYSMNLFYWTLRIVGAIGTIGLCRSLGISVWAAVFGGLAVTYSPVWTYLQYVLPLSQTLAWIPWSLWALESWLKRPNLRSSVLLAGACALVFLSGFPQGLHGTIIYMATTLIAAPFQPDLRRTLISNWPRRAGLGLLACGLCAGLAAVQLLPLSELIPLSYRGHGIQITLGGATSAASYLRGFLVTRPGSDASYFPGPGSLLICALASAAALLHKPSRLTGHACASLVLALLGMEFASPLFRFVYAYHLLPGLHYFRETFIYLAIATIGIGVIAAFGIDGLARCVSEVCVSNPAKNPRQFGYTRGLSWVLIAAFWTWSLICIPYNTVSLILLAYVVLAGLAALVLQRLRRSDILAPVVTLILIFEILTLRVHLVNFFNKNVFERPPEITVIKSIQNWSDYKMMTGSLAGTIALFPSLQSDLANRVRKAFAAISPHTNLLWNISSMNGYLALPLERRMAIEPLLQDEIFGRVTTPPGLRLIDLLAIRFITNGGVLSTAGFKTLYVDERGEMQTTDNKIHSLQENSAALPRFQYYSDCKVVQSLEDAVAAIEHLSSRTLIIENLNPAVLPRCTRGSNLEAADDASHKINLVEASDTEYRTQVTSRNGGWLFLADANYPGWIATLDGRNVPIFNGQVLGKAVSIPGGSHEVIFQFRPLSFYIGLVISLLSLVVAFVCGFAQLPGRMLARRPKL